MTYSQLQAFARAVAKDQYFGKQTTNYLGTIPQVVRSGLVRRHKPMGPESIMKTEKTSRACKGCRGTGVITKIHEITSQMSLEPHLSCKGMGEVYG